MTSLETRDGWLHKATFEADGGTAGNDEVTVEPIIDSLDNIVAVYISAEGAIELHDVPALIHALRCSLGPYGDVEVGGHRG